MSGLLNLKCRNTGCDFELERISKSILCLIDSFDKKIFLPHPREALKAKELTGKTLDDLSREKRLILEERKVCQKCFTSFLAFSLTKMGEIDAQNVKMKHI